MSQNYVDAASVNVTLGQFGQFKKTCDIKQGDGMFIAPADVVTVW